MKLKNMKTFEQHSSELNISDVINRLYSRSELINLLDIDGLSGLNTSDGSIMTNKKEIYIFKSEIQEAYNMTLEEYSNTSKRLYNFVFSK